MKRTVIGLCITAMMVTALTAHTQVRLKDIAFIKDQREIQLKGLGLVTGLDGTGDGKNTQFTVRMIGNMMTNLGLEVPTANIKVKNVAAVIVTATVSPYTNVGGSFDVTVSSIGDAKSLEGGTLLMSVLSDNNDIVYGKAQGALSTGGSNRDFGGVSAMVANASLAGTVPGGGILEREVEVLGTTERSLTVNLRNPDYTTAYRIATALNAEFGEQLSNARDAGSIIVSVPDSYSEQADMVRFISELENVLVEPDEQARVVINERTGTVIAGGNVSLSPVAIMHGTLSLNIGAEPDQAEAPVAGVNVQGNTGDRLVNFGESANVGQIARSLNLLGVTPRDLIAIFQALKVSGSLRAELLII